MNKKRNENLDLSWEELKYQIVCDRWGGWVTTNTYNASNHFYINANIEYHYLSEDEVADLRKEEQQKDHDRQKLQRHLIVLIRQIANEHFTTIQHRVLLAYLDGKSWTEIGDELNCSESTVRQVFWGNSRGNGGIVKKLQKLLPLYMTKYLELLQ